MSFSENKGLWLMVILTAATAVALIWILVSARPLRLVILYEEVGGLKQDDPLVLRGRTVGKVEEIKQLTGNQFGVTVRIREDQASTITHGTDFILRKASFFGLVGSNAIEAVTPSEAGTPFSSYEIVRGKVPPQASLIEQGKAWTREYWQHLTAETNQLLDELKSSPYRDHAAAVLDRLKALADEGAHEAGAGLDAFRKAHQRDLDDILKRLEQLRDEMRRKGDGAGATRVEKEIERVKGNPQP